MTQRTAHEVAGYWVGAGGPQRRAVEWVAIAFGESGWDDSAVSSAGAIGLWQIMPFNAPPYGFSASDLYNPAVNAAVAVRMSGGGTNCAAWDSCYRDIYASGRYSFLGFPEVGSADYNNLPIAARAIGGSAINPITGINTAPDVNSLREALRKIGVIQHTLLPSLVKQIVAARRVTEGAFMRDWRP